LSSCAPDARQRKRSFESSRASAWPISSVPKPFGSCRSCRRQRPEKSKSMSFAGCGRLSRNSSLHRCCAASFGPQSRGRQSLTRCPASLRWSPEVIPLSFRNTLADEGTSVRQLGLLDRCKAVITWCVLGIIFVRTLNALERDYTARLRRRMHDNRADRK
jgi:hypothetical protein